MVNIYSLFCLSLEWNILDIVTRIKTRRGSHDPRAHRFQELSPFYKTCFVIYIIYGLNKIYNIKKIHNRKTVVIIKILGERFSFKSSESSKYFMF